jgi:hypothetical protein
VAAAVVLAVMEQQQAQAAQAAQAFFIYITRRSNG